MPVQIYLFSFKFFIPVSNFSTIIHFSLIPVNIQFFSAKSFDMHAHINVHAVLVNFCELNKASASGQCNVVHFVIDIIDYVTLRSLLYDHVYTEISI